MILRRFLRTRNKKIGKDNWSKSLIFWDIGNKTQWICYNLAICDQGNIYLAFQVIGATPELQFLHHLASDSIAALKRNAIAVKLAMM